jgi:hypothetical protein
VLYRDAGEFDVAANYQQQSLLAELAGRDVAGGDPNLACDLSNLANDALMRGDHRSALALALSATRINQAGPADLADRAADWGTLGLVHLAERRCVDALRCLRTSLRIHRQLRDVRGIGCNMLHLGQTCAALGDWRRAERWIAWGVRMLRALPRDEIHIEAELLSRQVKARCRVAESDPTCN